MLEKFNKILCLAPHPDDIELGCGGTVSRLTEMGKEVYYCAFSLCEKSIPKGFSDNVLKEELENSCKNLGIHNNRIYQYTFEVREYKRNRQLILEELVKLKNELKPDLVFLPMPNDIHQDHCTISEEGIRAFKKSTILAYEVPWNNFSLENNLFIELTEEQLQKKIDALKAYKSQYFRSYANEEFVRSLAIVRGVQGKSKYAETFNIIRMYL